MAEVVTGGSVGVDGSRLSSLSVLAMADDAGPGGEAGTDYRVEVPVPGSAGQALGVERVKFSKKRSVLTVRLRVSGGSDARSADVGTEVGAAEEAAGESVDAKRGVGDDMDGLEVEGEEDEGENPLAEYLQMLGLKTAMKTAATPAEAEDPPMEAPDASTGESERHECPVCPRSDDPPPPLVRPRVKESTAGVGASSAASLTPAILTAALAAASKPSAGANSGVVVANGARPSHGAAAGSAAVGNNKKKNRGAKKNKRANTGQLAPLKCIRTARTIQAVSDMADDMAASLKVGQKGSETSILFFLTTRASNA